MTTPAMIIDFEATDVSKEAEATQLGWRNVSFDDQGDLVAEVVYYRDDNQQSNVRFCKPDRAISYGAMAVSHIMPSDVEHALSHKLVVPQYLPVGEAYIIGHNIDYDIQVAANASVDVSQYKRICTQALARRLLPELDSHSLGALTYAINPDLARQYCRNAHNAGWDVTFTLWLLEHLCELGDITSMEQLYLASEEARIPKIMPIGNDHRGKLIADMAKDPKDRGFLQWVVKTIKDKPYLVEACRQALITSINPNVSGMERQS
ncbi:3'-5' exonuclease [Psychrobacter sp. MES7-P7E]|uniref:3'-5' exonuclease n=1 Tax=Psychrobacter sp. MES7-P7E TaxID=2058322 RepID=UPI000C7ECDF0|nr:3'-5' exonuclease [Psychrobacter sp. MES7-P7E]PLT21112.1 DNA polymerase III subunit epsilon [Psychrobacter sp. MES7-P7E]